MEWGQVTDFAAEYSPIPYTGTVLNIASASQNTVTNLFGFTSGTCGKLPSDAQLASILARAPRDQPEMKRTRERFGHQADRYGGGAAGNPLAIYSAPLAEVARWMRYDCSSAGPIRKSLAADLVVLNQQYGAPLAPLTYGTLEAPAPVLTSVPDPGWTGQVGVSGSGVSGGLTFGSPSGQTASWVLLAVGAVAIIIVVWALLRGGR